MDSNPHLPPSSPVAELSGSRKSGGPPRGIVRAAWMLRFFILGSLPISTLLFVSSPNATELFLVGGGAMALPALFLALSWPLLTGRNWARIVTTIGAALFLAYTGTTVYAFLELTKVDDFNAAGTAALCVLTALTVLQAIGISAATAWLWGRSARRWFRERRSG